ncbi:hypothetical protein IMCC26134_02960 [Verrucomicrobia bacterium IMCC26134]|nr:hypothetical protein IMCC26134_02960 [Verrucomicrobia bacterium IMCC26134]
MNRILLLILSCTFGFQLSAQVIRSVDGRTAQLPAQFAVTPDGLKWVQSKSTDPVLILWNKIDLVALARDQPKIEEARQQVLLSNTVVYFSSPPKPNYYREFLSQKINVEFQQKWTAVSTGTIEYTTNTSGYAGYNPGYTGSDSRVTGTISLTTHYIDQTRPALNTTIEGLLLQLGEDDRIDTHRLINDLRESGGVFRNIQLLFSSLREIYPNDIEIYKASRGIDKLISERATSVDAMRQLKAFAIYARTMAK